MDEQAIESQRAIWESLSPRELELEHMRVCGEPPAEAAAKGDMIQGMLAKLRQPSAALNRP